MTEFDHYWSLKRYSQVASPLLLQQLVCLMAHKTEDSSKKGCRRWAHLQLLCFKTNFPGPGFNRDFTGAPLDIGSVMKCMLREDGRLWPTSETYKTLQQEAPMMFTSPSSQRQNDGRNCKLKHKQRPGLIRCPQRPRLCSHPAHDDIPSAIPRKRHSTIAPTQIWSS